MSRRELVTFTRQQLLALLAEVNGILGGEFPYEHSRDALKELKKKLVECGDQLDTAERSSDLALIESTCSTVAEEIQWSIGYVGFFLRSTNVRNAFEAWGPLLRLARRLLRLNSKLVISSEWEFSPFTFIGLSAFPDFVFIGLPAPESSNPFLLPIAGHELGHNVWANEKLTDKYQPVILSKILDGIRSQLKDFCTHTGLTVSASEIATNMFAVTEWLPFLRYAIEQCQEVFCDCLGTRLFGGSYICAFEYLLAPHTGGVRAPTYPSDFDRTQTIIAAANAYNISPISSTFANMCAPSPSVPPKNRDELLLGIADATRASLNDELIREADILTGKAGVSKPNDDLIKKCLKRFQQISPAETMSEISEILIAGWLSVKTVPFYPDPKHEEQKHTLISELVWKSIEVFEIEQRLK